MHSTTAPSTSRTPWLINRNFALLWSGQCLSQVGNYLLGTTVVLYMVTGLARNQPWASLAISGLLLLQTLPSFALLPIAGVWVDRWDRRRTMLRIDASRAAVVMSLLLFGGEGEPVPFHLSSPWLLGLFYGSCCLISIGGQFFNPSQFALLGEVVPEAQRPRASGLDLMTANLAMLIGPTLAGPLYFAGGMRLALALDALSFLYSWLTILLMRVPARVAEEQATPRPSFFRDFRAGVQLFLRHPTLRVIACSLAIAMFGLGVLNALDVFFVTQTLHAPAALYGLLSTALGLGSIAGATLGPWLVRRIGLARTFGLSMLGVGGLVLLFARMPSFLPALFVFCLLGVPNAINNVALGPLILNATPPPFTGRVISLLTPVWSSVFAGSIVVSGFLYSSEFRRFHATLFGMRLGPVDTLLMGTGLLVMGAAIYALFHLGVVPKHAS